MNTAAPTHEPKGHLCIVLHAHLPFVRHQECDYFLEENWLFEAITETYIPLLAVFEKLASDGVPFKITMTMTPPLTTMLTDDLLQQRYVPVNRDGTAQRYRQASPGASILLDGGGDRSWEGL